MDDTKKSTNRKKKKEIPKDEIKLVTVLSYIKNFTNRQLDNLYRDIESDIPLVL